MKKKTSPNTKPEASIPATCPECSVGYLKRRNVAYFTWMGEELISVPDFPAWVCDVCGRREYDTQALNWLAAMLNPHAGKHVRAANTRVSGSSDSIGSGIQSISSK